MIANKSIFYNGQTWNYVIHYKTQKNMYLKVEAEKIIVSAPLFITTTAIEDFIIINLPKIIKRINNKPKKTPQIALGSDPFVMIFNQKVRIIFKFQKQTNFVLNDQSLYIYSPLVLNWEQNQPKILQKLELFLKKIVTPVFYERITVWEKQMQLKVQKLQIRNMKSKWGVCYPLRETITLNQHLIHFDYAVIDYVIIHELAHLLYPNHNAQFWTLVAKYSQNYKTHRMTLNHALIGTADGKD